MFGYGWVRTRLGLVFSDAFGLFWGFWLDFWKNGRNQQNLGKFGVLCRDVGIPRRNVGPRQGMARPRRGVAEREVWTASGTPQCSSAMSR